MAKALIEAGADLNITNNDGGTALHTAAFLCRTEIGRALLDNGANKYLRDNFGNMALESVAAPFDDVKGIYDSFGQALGPLGLNCSSPWRRSPSCSPSGWASLGSGASAFMRHGWLKAGR